MAGPVSNQGAKDKTAEADKTTSATTRRTQPGGSFGPLAEIMVLQRTIGNQAVGQWLAEMSEDEEADADGLSASPAIPSAAAGEPSPASKSPLQPKLKISQPNDPAELEAEAMSQAIFASEDTGKGPPSPDAADHPGVQRKAGNGSGAASSGVSQALGSSSQPLDKATRDFMEPHFGQDFSQVRVHTGQEAAQSAQSVNALAYTVGPDIVFGEGQYQPGSESSQKLLAHELTHVVQQGSAPSTAEGGPVVHRAPLQIARGGGKDGTGATATKLRSLTRIHLIPLEHKAIYFVTNSAPVILYLTTCTIKPGTYNVKVQFQVTEIIREEEKRRRVFVAIDASKEELTRMGGGFAVGGDGHIGFDPDANYDEYVRGIPLVVGAPFGAAGGTGQGGGNPKAGGGNVPPEAAPPTLDSPPKPKEAAPPVSTGDSGGAKSEGDDGDTVVHDDSNELGGGGSGKPGGGSGEPGSAKGQTGEPGGNDKASQEGEEGGVPESKAPGESNKDADPTKPKSDFKDPGAAGGEGDRIPANAPAMPMTMDGLDKQPVGGSGQYTAHLTYSPEQQNSISMNFAAMKWINYHWEIYDVSGEVQNLALDSKAQREAAAKTKLDPKKAKEATKSDAAEADIERSSAEVAEDTGNAKMRLAEAAEQGDVTGVLTNLVSLHPVLRGASKIVNVGGAILGGAADVAGGTDNEIGIPWTKPGTYVVRAVARPDPEKKTDGSVFQRAASVAVKAVTVMKSQELAKELLGEQSSQLEELKLKYTLTEDEAEKARLAAQIEQLELALNAPPWKVLYNSLLQKQAELKQAEAIPDPFKVRDLKAQIENLQLQIGLANQREVELRQGGAGEILKPQATIASEITGQSYPLLLQLGITPPKDGSKLYQARISDVTTKDGRGDYTGTGDSASTAAWSAVKSLAAGNSYGRGQLAVQLPENEKYKFDPTQMVYPNRPLDGALVRKRLEDMAAVVGVVAMFVPGLGEVAMVLGAGLAADRLYQRARNGTLRADPEAVNDVLNIAGALLPGITKIGSLQVVQEGNSVFLRSIKAAGTLAETGGKLVNEVQWVLGNADTYQKIIDINQAVLSGKMSQSEARKQRAQLLNSFAQQNAQYIKGKIDEHNQTKTPETPALPKPGAPEETTPGTRKPASEENNTPKPATEENTPATPKSGADENTPATPKPASPVPGEEGSASPDQATPPKPVSPASPDATGDSNVPKSEQKGTRSAGLVDDLAANPGQTPNLKRGKLLAGDVPEMQNLLNQAGNWKELLGTLSEHPDPRMAKIAENLVKYRDGVVGQLESLFGAKPVSGASSEVISDVDLSTYGTHAGDDMLRAEAYMANKYGADWSAKLRMNFYTEAGRLTQYSEAMPNLSPAAQAQVQQNMTHLTEKFNFARMLQHAAGDEAATRRVEQLAEGAGFKLSEVADLAGMDAKTRNEQRTKLLKEADGLMERYEKATGSERDQLAVEISKKQIEANFYVDEAYIGPGAGLMTVGGERVTGVEACQAALSNLEMVEHIMHQAGGDIVKACREYELYKYIHRFAQASRFGGVESPKLSAFENIAAFLYRTNRQAHSEQPGRVNAQAERENAKKHSNKGIQDRPVPTRADEPGGKPASVSPETLKDLFNSFQDMANQAIPELKKKADAASTPEARAAVPAAEPPANKPVSPRSNEDEAAKAPDTEPQSKAPDTEPESKPPVHETGPDSKAPDTEPESKPPEMKPESKVPPVISDWSELELAHYGLTEKEAWASYDESLKVHPNMEVGLWMDPATGEHIVVQGDRASVPTGWSTEEGLTGRKWKLVEHFHPGEGRARFASGQDFMAMREHKISGREPDGPDTTRIRWLNPKTKAYEFTDIGYDPAESKPYWIKYLDREGSWQVKRFEDTPWNGGSDYGKFLEEQRVPAAGAANPAPAEKPGSGEGTGPKSPDNSPESKPPAGEAKPEPEARPAGPEKAGEDEGTGGTAAPSDAPGDKGAAAASGLGLPPPTITTIGKFHTATWKDSSKAKARFSVDESQPGRVIVEVYELYRGEQPKGSGGQMLADALRAVGVHRPDLFLLTEIVNELTLNQINQGKDFKETLLGKTFANTIAEFGGKIGEAQVHYSKVGRREWRVDATIKVTY